MDRKNAPPSSSATAGEPSSTTVTSSSGQPPAPPANNSPDATMARYNDMVDDIITRLSTTDEEDHSDTDHYREGIRGGEKQPLLKGSSSNATKKRTTSKTAASNAMNGIDKPNGDHMVGGSTSSHHSFFIYLVTILSAIGGFLFGYDTGIVSGAMVFIRDHFHLSPLWQEIIVSATILAAWIFSLFAGYLTNRFGRKWVVILASAIFTVGGLMMALAPNKELLLAGRFTVGMAIGLASMVIPVYIAEVAPVQIRGKLVTINVCFITFGQFVASILAGLFSSNTKDGWRWMLGLASVPSFLQMVFFVFLPESPRWLMQKGRYDEAYESLAKFRVNTSVRDIDSEYDSIKDNCLASQREQESASIGRILGTPAVRRALFVGCLLMMFQQLAGINTVMYYSATIIQMSGVHDKSTAVWMSAATASVNFILSFVGLALVEKLGRRMLILTSLCGVIMALMLLGVGFQMADNNSPAVTFSTANQSICSMADTCNQCVHSKCGFCYFENQSPLSSSLSTRTVAPWLGAAPKPDLNGTCLMVDAANPLHSAGNTLCSNGTDKATHLVWTNSWCPSKYSWMTLAGLMLYLFFFAPGMGPMPWTITSEIYPLWARGVCCSVSTSFNWFFNLLVSLTFLSLTEWLTNHGAYYLYAGIALVGWLSFYVFLPETKGKSLEEIELLFDRPLMSLGKSKANSNYAQMNGSSQTTNTLAASNTSIRT